LARRNRAAGRAQPTHRGRCRSRRAKTRGLISEFGQGGEQSLMLRRWIDTLHLKSAFSSQRMDILARVLKNTARICRIERVPGPMDHIGLLAERTVLPAVKVGSDGAAATKEVMKQLQDPVGVAPVLVDEKVTPQAKVDIAGVRGNLIDLR